MDSRTRWHLAQFTPLLATVMCLLVSCSEESTPQKLVRPCLINGTVTLDNRPLASGSVTFIPRDKRTSEPVLGFASIDEHGRFWVGNSNLDKPAGLEPGRYRATVLVMKPRPDGPDGPIARMEIPSIYSREDSTPFEFEFKPGQHDIRLDLTSRPVLRENVRDSSAADR